MARNHLGLCALQVLDATTAERAHQRFLKLESRLRFFRAVKVKIIHMHESGTLSVGPARLLMEAIDETMDTIVYASNAGEAKADEVLAGTEDWLSWDYLVLPATWTIPPKRWP